MQPVLEWGIYISLCETFPVSLLPPPPIFFSDTDWD